MFASRKTKMILSDWKHIIWDWNGTLLDDVQLCIDIINLILDRHSLPRVNFDSYRNLVDFPIKEYYRRLGFDFSKNSFESLGTEFIDIYKKSWRNCRLQKGAESGLRLFKDAEISQSILSATDIRLLKSGVEFFGISPFFHELTAHNHYYATSKVELGREFLDRHGLMPAKILMIGDTAHDYHVASALKCPCLLLGCGHHPPEKLAALGVPVLKSLDELPALLSSKLSGS